MFSCHADVGPGLSIALSTFERRGSLSTILPNTALLWSRLESTHRGVPRAQREPRAHARWSRQRVSSV